MMKTQNHDVWLVLAKVEVVGKNPANLRPGSEALVQCFIPERSVETALARSSDLLVAEGMRRMDVLTCTRFDANQTLDDTPEVVKRDVLAARSSGKAATGTFFTSKETASVDGQKRK